ncbi:MAG: metallophosphoesterase [Anaerolineae bacterium]|nr:metallophosphoesterase [Anaerolineae bacterium]
MGVGKSNNRQLSSEESRFHQVLVFTNTLQKLPTVTLILLIVMFSGIVALAWQDHSDVPVLYLLAASLNWVLLWLLPRVGRSYGPDRPSALALALLLMVLLLLPGLLGASDVVGIGLMILLTVVVFYATWVEPFNLRVIRQNYVTAKLQADAPALQVLHIGDIHVERITPREQLLNKLIAELKPDIIVFSGDFVNLSYTHDDQAKAAIREVLQGWHAPLGVYCVPGTQTVEPLNRVKQFVSGLSNIKLLLNQWVTVDTPGGKFHILGMTTTHDLDVDCQTLSRLLENAPPAGFKLLLTHAPDVAPEADLAGIDLYVCGHTHGGQIRLPLIGELFSGSHLGRKFVMGRYDLERTTVYTTRGVGLEGLGAPRARLLCPPEIILWELKGNA